MRNHSQISGMPMMGLQSHDMQLAGIPVGPGCASHPPATARQHFQVCFVQTEAILMFGLFYHC